MLLFNADGKQIQIEREGIEAAAQNQLLDKVNMMRQEEPLFYQAAKMAIEIISTRLEVNIPPGVNKVDFLVCYLLKNAMDMIENKPILVNAKVVDLNAKDDSN